MIFGSFQTRFLCDFIVGVFVAADFLWIFCFHGSSCLRFLVIDAWLVGKSVLTPRAAILLTQRHTVPDLVIEIRNCHQIHQNSLRATVDT